MPKVFKKVKRAKVHIILEEMVFFDVFFGNFWRAFLGHFPEQFTYQNNIFLDSILSFFSNFAEMHLRTLVSKGRRAPVACQICRPDVIVVTTGQRRLDPTSVRGVWSN